MTDLNNNMRDLSVNDNYWYSAQTNLGVIYIGLERKYVSINSQVNQLPEILQKALILNKGEVLIRHLEDWLACGLVLSPATIIPNSIYTIVMCINSVNHETDLNCITVGFQYNLLDKLSDTKPLLPENIRLEVSDISILFVLSEFKIATEQYELIEDGNILLIPDSYNGDWRIKLQNIMQPKMSLSGILRKDIKTLIIDNHTYEERNLQNRQSGQKKYDEDDYRLLSITLRDTIPIPLDLLLGWSDENTLMLDFSLRHYKADVRCNSNLIASGHLISVGDGYGLSIKK
jgi:flagellar motor switch/type III secretory pathway protein FliN